MSLLKPLVSLPRSSTALFSVVARNDLNEVEELLKDIENFSQIDQAVILEEENLDQDSKNLSGDWTPLLWACHNGLTAIAIALINKGADIHKLRETKGSSCLYFACFPNSPQLVQFLIEKGANVNEKDNDGFFPLYVASQKGHIEVVEILTKHGADVHEKDNKGFFPLYSASAQGHVEVVELLMKNGANVNEQNKNGWTSLDIASFNGHGKVVELLLQNGALVNEKNNKGFFPLYVASENGQVKIVELLIKHGANVNEKNNAGYSSLLIASEQGHVEVVKLLIKYGASIDEQIQLTNIPINNKATPSRIVPWIIFVVFFYGIHIVPSFYTKKYRLIIYFIF